MRRTHLLLNLVAVLILTGCGAGLQPPSGMSGAPAATAAVERFLQLAGERDYEAMGWIFGTADGPIFQRDPPGQVERRMYGLADLLQHQSYLIGNGSPVPGRRGAAMRFNVILTRRGETVQVPFTAVMGPDDRWYVEQLDVEALMAS